MQHNGENDKIHEGNQYSRMVRLLSLIQEIRNDPLQKLSDLLGRMGISKSQFYKDRQTLAEFGFVFDYRKVGGFKILEDRIAPVSHLTLSDRMVLMFALQHLSCVGEGHLVAKAIEVGRKLAGGLDEPFRTQITEIFNSVVVEKAYGCVPEIVEGLEKAISESQRIRILYSSSSTKNWEKAWYEIDPLRIYFLHRGLYLYANCPGKNPNYRSFRINRISSIEPTGISRTVRIPDDGFYLKLKNAFQAFLGDEAHTVKVRFKGEASVFVRENVWHQSQRIEVTGDKEIVFTVKVAEPREVLWWSLQFAQEAEILEPEWLRGEAREMAQNIVQIYS